MEWQGNRRYRVRLKGLRYAITAVGRRRGFVVISSVDTVTYFFKDGFCSRGCLPLVWCCQWKCTRFPSVYTLPPIPLTMEAHAPRATAMRSRRRKCVLRLRPSSSAARCESATTSISTSSAATVMIEHIKKRRKKATDLDHLLPLLPKMQSRKVYACVHTSACCYNSPPIEM